MVWLRKMGLFLNLNGFLVTKISKLIIFLNWLILMISCFLENFSKLFILPGALLPVTDLPLIEHIKFQNFSANGGILTVLVSTASLPLGVASLIGVSLPLTLLVVQSTT
jgi:hypothetical protein